MEFDRVTAPTGFPGIDDWPHISPQALTECFVLTHILPPKTSQEVTHPRITPSQARLTWKFLRMSYRKGRCTFGDTSSHHIPFKPFSPPFRCQVSLPSLEACQKLPLTRHFPPSSGPLIQDWMSINICHPLSG